MGNSSPSVSPPPTSKDGKDIGHWISSRGRLRVRSGAINLKANVYKDFSIPCALGMQHTGTGQKDSRCWKSGPKRAAASSLPSGQGSITPNGKIRRKAEFPHSPDPGDIIPRDIKGRKGSSHLAPWSEINFVCFSFVLGHNTLNNSLLPAKKASFTLLGIQGSLSTATSAIFLWFYSSFFQY